VFKGTELDVYCVVVVAIIDPF